MGNTFVHEVKYVFTFPQVDKSILRILWMKRKKVGSKLSQGKETRSLSNLPFKKRLTFTYLTSIPFKNLIHSFLHSWIFHYGRIDGWMVCSLHSKGSSQVELTKQVQAPSSLDSNSPLTFLIFFQKDIWAQVLNVLLTFQFIGLPLMNKLTYLCMKEQTWECEPHADITSCNTYTWNFTFISIAQKYFWKKVKDENSHYLRSGESNLGKDVREPKSKSRTSDIVIVTDL